MIAFLELLRHPQHHPPAAPGICFPLLGLVTAPPFTAKRVSRVLLRDGPTGAGATHRLRRLTFETWPGMLHCARVEELYDDPHVTVADAPVAVSDVQRLVARGAGLCVPLLGHDARFGMDGGSYTLFGGEEGGSFELSWWGQLDGGPPPWAPLTRYAAWLADELDALLATAH